MFETQKRRFREKGERERERFSICLLTSDGPGWREKPGTPSGFQHVWQGSRYLKNHLLSIQAGAQEAELETVYGTWTGTLIWNMGLPRHDLNYWATTVSPRLSLVFSLDTLFIISILFLFYHQLAAFYFISIMLIFVVNNNQ